jgi:hypothetical protein
MVCTMSPSLMCCPTLGHAAGRGRRRRRATSSSRACLDLHGRGVRRRTRSRQWQRRARKRARRMRVRGLWRTEWRSRGPCVRSPRAAPGVAETKSAKLAVTGGSRVRRLTAEFAQKQQWWEMHIAHCALGCKPPGSGERAVSRRASLRNSSHASPVCAAAGGAGIRAAAVRFELLQKPRDPEDVRTRRDVEIPGTLRRFHSTAQQHRRVAAVQARLVVCTASAFKTYVPARPDAIGPLTPTFYRRGVDFLYCLTERVSSGGGVNPSAKCLRVNSSIATRNAR